MPHRNGEKITNHFKISSPLKNEMNRDFIFIGYPDDIKYLKKDFDLINLKSPNQNFTKKDIGLYEVRFK